MATNRVLLEIEFDQELTDPTDTATALAEAMSNTEGVTEVRAYTTPQAITIPGQALTTV